MATTEQTPVITTPVIDTHGDTRGPRGASWSAIFSGVSISAALYLVLLILGAGLGFTALSPANIRNQDYVFETIGVATVFWIILTQIISSGGGGYIAGRLASKDRENLGYQQEKHHFYHMAHGLVVWALATTVIVFALGTTASKIVMGGTSMIAAVGKGAVAGVGAAYLGSSSKPSKYSLLEWDRGDRERSTDSKTHSSASSPDSDDIVNYAIDMLFRPLPNTTSSNETSANQGDQTKTHRFSDYNSQRREVLRIFANAIQKNKMSDADKNYVAGLVSERTGMSHGESLRRVEQTFDQIDGAMEEAETQGKKVLDSARHAAAVTALWTFVTLLGGAVVAAGAACYGGRARPPKKRRDA